MILIFFFNSTVYKFGNWVIYENALNYALLNET